MINEQKVGLLKFRTACTFDRQKKPQIFPSKNNRICVWFRFFHCQGPFFYIDFMQCMINLLKR